jgi:general secretion pathway protein K
MSVHRRQQGVILLIVLFFALMLTSSITIFIRRSTVDAIVARNRDAVAETEALARSGIRLGKALLVIDRDLETITGLALDTHLDPWAQIREMEFEVGTGARLRIQVIDSGALFNLNALFDQSEEGGGAAFQQTEPFLKEFLEKVIDEIDLPPGEKFYDVADLAENLIDWMDSDTERLKGGLEDDYYQSQYPPYRAANGPLLSIDDLHLIEGFDRTLVKAIRPYVTVMPFAGGMGVNFNTAPPHILALIYSNDGIDDRLAHDDEVKMILKAREDGGMICDESLGLPDCTPISEIMPNPVFPTPTFSTPVFRIVARATLGEVSRTVEATFNRSLDPPLLLSWQVR